MTRVQKQYIESKHKQPTNGALLQVWLDIGAISSGNSTVPYFGLANIKFPTTGTQELLADGKIDPSDNKEIKNSTEPRISKLRK